LASVLWGVLCGGVAGAAGAGGGGACSKKTPTLTSERCAGADWALKSSWSSFVVRSGAEGRETKRSKM
jgi:hypothetical protein